MNKSRTCDGGGSKLTRAGSRPVLYEVIDKTGVAQPGGFTTASRAFEYARRLFPDQEQDPERSGKGWDIQAKKA